MPGSVREPVGEFIDCHGFGLGSHGSEAEVSDGDCSVDAVPRYLGPHPAHQDIAEPGKLI